MHDRLKSLPPSESLKRGHEAAPPHLRNVCIVISAVVVLIFFGLAMAGGFFHFLSRNRAMQSMQPLGILIAPNLQPLQRFPIPNLEIDDGHAQLTALRARQEEKLNSYGWVDSSNGVVRIPIDRAMQLLLQRGLPARTNSMSGTGISPLELIQERPEQP